jgi:hypothetical protein
MTNDARLRVREIVSRFPSTQVRVEEFPSGAWILDAHVDDALFVLEAHPGGQYIVSEMTDETPFNSGARQTYASLETACQALQRMLAGHTDHLLPQPTA